MVFTKHAWSPWYSSFGLFQVPSNKVRLAKKVLPGKKALYDQTYIHLQSMNTKWACSLAGRKWKYLTDFTHRICNKAILLWEVTHKSRLMHSWSKNAWSCKHFFTRALQVGAKQLTQPCKAGIPNKKGLQRPGNQTTHPAWMPDGSACRQGKLKCFKEISAHFENAYHIHQPLRSVGYDTRSIFKWSLTGLNSEFSFSYTSCLTKAEEPSPPYYLPIAGGRMIGFIPFPRVLVLCEM